MQYIVLVIKGEINMAVAEKKNTNVFPTRTLPKVTEEGEG